MITLTGRVTRGFGHWTHRIARNQQAFESAIGETLYPGTLNIQVPAAVLVRPEFVVYGDAIGEGEDFLIERVLVGGLPCYRVRPYRLFDGIGGWGDHTLEILSAFHLRMELNLGDYASVEVGLYRRDMYLPDE